MKKLMIAALVAGQVIPGAAAAQAAELAATEAPRTGAFGGLRVRLPLDGRPGERRLRAGLTLAPTLTDRAADGALRRRIGEGLELGISGRGPVRLSIAGQDLRRLGAAQGEAEDEDEGGGPSTIGWIAIGVGAVLVLTVGAIALCMDDSECNPSE
jgi:hypothetical protein